LQIEDGDSHGEIVLGAMSQLSVKQVLGAFGFDRPLPAFAQASLRAASASPISKNSMTGNQ
jgi:hypothetical protein